jgi:hypothetical protein
LNSSGNGTEEDETGSGDEFGSGDESTDSSADSSTNNTNNNNKKDETDDLYIIPMKGLKSKDD